MAVKKYLRKRKQKGEGRPAQQFFQAEPAHEQADGNSFSFFPPGLQAKLSVSQPGDPQEKEADRMADKVVQRKGDGPAISSASAASSTPAFSPSPASTAIPNASGSSLPTPVIAEMSSSFGHDFSKVRIHTDAKAQEAAAGLRAQAFTYGGEIFFNKGKFNPGTSDGKWLLAHELTHVVQQSGQAPAAIQKRDEPEVSTPVPDTMTTNRDKQTNAFVNATGMMSKTNVTILPDTVGPVPAGKSAVTNISYTIAYPGNKSRNGKVIEVTGAAVINITIQTVYKQGVNKTATSAYGRGTTAADKAAGNTSLRFHEGSHGDFVFTYLANNAVPNFTGASGQTVADFAKAKDQYIADANKYMAALIASNESAVDCTGTKASTCP